MGNGLSATDLIMAAGRLDREHIPPGDKEWEVFWQAPSTMTSICSTIQPNDVRQLRYRQPRNLANLVRKAIEKLDVAARSLEKPHYPAALAASRILTRVMPVLLEDPRDDFVDRLLWNGEVPTGYASREEALRVGVDPSGGPAPYGPSWLGDARDERNIDDSDDDHQDDDAEDVDDDDDNDDDDDEEEEDDDEDYEEEVEGDDDVRRGSPVDASLATADSQTLAHASTTTVHDSPEPDTEGSGAAGVGKDIGGAAAVEVAAAGVEATVDDADATPRETAAVVVSEQVASAAAQVEENLLETAQRTMREVAAGHLPPGFRRAQQPADITQPAPRLRWAPAAPLGGAAVAEITSAPPPGRVLVHSLARLLFAPSLCVDDGAFAFYSNKIRVMRDKTQRAALVRRLGARAPDTSASSASAASAASASAAAPALVAGAAESTGAPASDSVGSGEAAEGPDGSQLDDRNAIWPTLLWCAGVAYPTLDVLDNGALRSNRTELLRLIIAICSKPLFRDPDPDRPVRSRLVDELVSRNCPFGPTLFYSLINTIVSYDPDSWAALLPFGGAVGGEPRETHVETALQALLILLDYNPTGLPRGSVDAVVRYMHHQPLQAPVDPLGFDDDRAERSDGDRPGAAGPEPSPVADTVPISDLPSSTDPHARSHSVSPSRLPPPAVNMFRSMLAAIRHPDDLRQVYRGVTRMLTSILKADQSMLPGSTASVPFYQELVTLLWVLLNINDAFVTHIVREEDANEMCLPLLYFLWTGRLNPARVQFLQLCAFILFLLSGFRDFAVGLNAPLTVTLPNGIPVQAGAGTHGDVLLVVLHKLIVNATRRMRPLYNCIMTIIFNVSPYLKGISLIAAVKLTALLTILTTPRFLFARSDNLELLGLLIGALANVVQYQFDTNAELIYGLVQAQPRLEFLTALTLEQAIDAHNDAVSRALTSALGEDAPATAGEDDVGPEPTSNDDEASAVVPAPRLSAAAAADHVEEEEEEEEEEETKSDDEADAELDDAAGVSELARPSGDGTAANADEGAASSSSSHLVAADVPMRPDSHVAIHWQPTRDWLAGQLRHLELLPTLLMAARYLSALLRRRCADNAKAGMTPDDDSLIRMIRQSTLVGVLPQPHKIMSHRYSPNKHTALWLTTYVWGVIYLRGIDQLPLFSASRIRLFHLQIT